MAVDPVCGMQVDERNARFKSEHQGKTYYFCSAGCQREFERDPGQFVKGGQKDHPKHHG